MDSYLESLSEDNNRFKILGELYYNTRIYKKELEEFKAIFKNQKEQRKRIQAFKNHKKGAK